LLQPVVDITDPEDVGIRHELGPRFVIGQRVGQVPFVSLVLALPGDQVSAHTR
jgi:hypothetical protein